MTIVQRFLLDSSFLEQPKFGQVRLGRNRVKRRVKILEIRRLAYCLSIMKRWYLEMFWHHSWIHCAEIVTRVKLRC